MTLSRSSEYVFQKAGVESPDIWVQMLAVESEKAIPMYLSTVWWYLRWATSHLAVASAV